MAHPRLVLLSLVLLSFAACDAGPGTEAGDEETDGGDGPESVTLVAEADPSLVCGELGGSVTFETRRVDCWDPPLPCTVAQDPPWIAGTTDSCDTLVPGVVRLEVEVSQTGRWQTRLQSGDGTECFGLDGEALTNVAKDDLASGAEIVLSPAPAADCSNP